MRGRERFTERYIGRSLRSGRGPRLRGDDSIILRDDKRIGGRPFLSFSCHPREGGLEFTREFKVDLRKVERGAGISLHLFMERDIGCLVPSARGPRLRGDDNSFIYINGLSRGRLA